MAWAIIKIKDNSDGSIEFKAELSDPPDNNSNAHQTVLRFIESADKHQTIASQPASVINKPKKKSLVGINGERLEVGK